MIVNRAGDLSVEYFQSYFKLLMNTRNFDIVQAKEFMFKRFFNEDVTSLGECTYQRFEQAYSSLKDE
ncbi:hypothetical protein [Priestia endophytica]|uniref:hypothetical protein n=1 Tax=Priestia endophytica TaxID=135735 RepID=UPI00227F5A41|nr:hypothetical protein [Priestia endophytica]MCY8235357.1 hypothetical protein [Priestia endophytica]